MSEQLSTISDFYAWANEQAALLRAGRLTEADIENIAEEIESMGRSEKRELVNRLAVLLLHLLKWQFQPALRGNSWRLTIEEHAIELEDHLERQSEPEVADLDQAMRECLSTRRVMRRSVETGLARSTFPDRLPLTPSNRR